LWWLKKWIKDSFMKNLLCLCGEVRSRYPRPGPGPAARGREALSHMQAREGGEARCWAITISEITSIRRDNPASIAYPDTSIIFHSFPSYAVLRTRESTTAIMPMIKTSLSAMPYQSGV